MTEFGQISVAHFRKKWFPNKRRGLTSISWSMFKRECWSRWGTPMRSSRSFRNFSTFSVTTQSKVSASENP